MLINKVISFINIYCICKDYKRVKLSCNILCYKWDSANATRVHMCVSQISKTRLQKAIKRNTYSVTIQIFIIVLDIKINTKFKGTFRFLVK